MPYPPCITWMISNWPKLERDFSLKYSKWVFFSPKLLIFDFLCSHDSSKKRITNYVLNKKNFELSLVLRITYGIFKVTYQNLVRLNYSYNFGTRDLCPRQGSCEGLRDTSSPQFHPTRVGKSGDNSRLIRDNQGRWNRWNRWSTCFTGNQRLSKIK